MSRAEIVEIDLVGASQSRGHGLQLCPLAKAPSKETP